MTDLAVDAAIATVDDERKRRIDEATSAGAPRRHRDNAASSGATDQDSLADPSPQTASRRRAHPAAGARIGTAGFGLATMLGLIAAMGFARRSTASDVDAPAASVPPQVVVVVHRALHGSATAKPPTSMATAPSGPIVLTARPIVPVWRGTALANSEHRQVAEHRFG